MLVAVKEISEDIKGSLITKSISVSTITLSSSIRSSIRFNLSIMTTSTDSRTLPVLPHGKEADDSTLISDGRDPSLATMASISEFSDLRTKKKLFLCILHRIVCSVATTVAERGTS